MIYEKTRNKPFTVREFIQFNIDFLIVALAEAVVISVGLIILRLGLERFLVVEKSIIDIVLRGISMTYIIGVLYVYGCYLYTELREFKESRQKSH